METKYVIVIAVVAIIAIQVGGLLLLGQPLLCNCAQVKLWEGEVQSTQSSQHVFDWYTFSHVISGFLVYFALWLLRKKLNWPKSMAVAFLIVIIISATWELFENTHFAINRFQQNTIVSQYQGDSILNAVTDTVAMSAGFWLAYLLPVWFSVVVVVGLEIFMVFFTRDGLVLHTIMFVYPVKSIFHWQASLMQ